MSATLIEKYTQENEKLLDALLNLVDTVQKNPEKSKLTFSATSRLTQGFKAEVESRNFRFVSDEPESLGGSDEGPNPVEYVLGALAACQEIVVKAHATVLGVNISEVRVDVEGELDVNGLLNLGDVRAGFSNITFHTSIKTDENDPEKLEKIKQLTLNNCPVLDIIKNPVPISGEVEFIHY